MTDRLDPAPHVANARQLADLATRARAAYHERLVDDGTRLGVERDQAARAKSSAEQQRTTAEAQSKRELRVAEQADKAAADLERRAGSETPRLGSDQELREQAAELRAKAEVARRRAHAADEESDALRLAAERHQQTIEGLDAQLGATGTMRRVELQIDALELHAELADAMARAAQRGAELQQQASIAASRGDAVLAKRLAAQTDEEWATVNDLGRARTTATPPVDTAQLTEIGIDVPPSAFDVPGFTDPTFDAEATPASTSAGSNGSPRAVGAPMEPLAAADVMGTDAVSADLPSVDRNDADLLETGAISAPADPAERVALVSAPEGEDEPVGTASAAAFDVGELAVGDLAMADPATDEPVTAEPAPVDDVDTGPLEIA